MSRTQLPAAPNREIHLSPPRIRRTREGGLDAALDVEQDPDVNLRSTNEKRICPPAVRPRNKVHGDGLQGGGTAKSLTGGAETALTVLVLCPLDAVLGAGLDSSVTIISCLLAAAESSATMDKPLIPVCPRTVSWASAAMPSSVPMPIRDRRFLLSVISLPSTKDRHRAQDPACRKMIPSTTPRAGR